MNWLVAAIPMLAGGGGAALLLAAGRRASSCRRRYVGQHRTGGYRVDDLTALAEAVEVLAPRCAQTGADRGPGACLAAGDGSCFYCRLPATGPVQPVLPAAWTNPPGGTAASPAVPPGAPSLRVVR